MLTSFQNQISDNSKIQVMKCNEQENDSYYSVEINLSELSHMEAAFNNFFDSISARDESFISLTVDYLNPIEISSMNEYKEFEQKFKEDFLGVVDEESIYKLIIRINKKVVDNRLSFYSLPLFKNFLLTKNISHGLSLFKKLIKENGFIHIIIMDDDIKDRNLIYTDVFRN